MKQITQTELLQVIKDKQESAQNDFCSLIKETKKGYRTLEESQNIGFKQAKLQAYIEAYEDLICFIESREIVPEEQIVTTIPKAKQKELGITQEQLKEMIEKTPITPYNEPKVEPLIEKRFREFIDFGLGYTIGRKEMVDAKSIQFIRFFKGEETYVVEIWCGCGYITNETFTEEARAIAYYNDLVEWWKYWKQN